MSAKKEVEDLKEKYKKFRSKTEKHKWKSLTKHIIRHHSLHEICKIFRRKKRRETWEELVTRNKKMHIKKYPNLER